jgi:hypothetical protein
MTTFPVFLPERRSMKACGIFSNPEYLVSWIFQGDLIRNGGMKHSVEGRDSYALGFLF